MKKNYIIPSMCVKVFNAPVHLATNSDLVRQKVSQAGYTSINMTEVKTKNIEWN